MKEKSLLLRTDTYKGQHCLQYPEGTTKVYSYLCARSNKKFDKTLYFGDQYYLHEFFSAPPTKRDVDRFMKYMYQITGVPYPPELVQKFYNVVDLGYWPLHIKAVPQGTMVDNKNVLFTITNTHPDAYWLVGLTESLLLKIWNPSTVATYSKKLKTLCQKYAELSCDNGDHVYFQVHDFGYRGCSSEETAEISGSAHLVNFLGTDTVPAVVHIDDYYRGAECDIPIGLSVAASEHSVMCSFGREFELDAFKNMLKLYPSGIVSIVSDTYDLWNVLTNFAVELKDQIIARDGKVVFRPDSGDPEKIILGNPDAPIGSPEAMGALRLLEAVFGSTVNEKGFRILNQKVGLIYGDGMYYERIVRIFDGMLAMGFASSNLVMGIGGLLLQQHTRDDLAFALKATYVEVNSEKRTVMKDPITDPGKKSHKGLMKLTQKDGVYVTVDEVSEEEESQGLLETVYLDGKIMRNQTFDDIRQRAGW